MRKVRGPAWEALKARLIARRLELKLSQGDLAARIERDRTAVTNWEVGHNRPRVEMLLAWMEALELEISLKPKEER